MSIRLERPDLGDLAAMSSREWLETNGLGGWAASTVAGVHTRRYHGLLVAALRPPTDRFVLLSRLDETLGVGGERFELGCNRYPGVVHPQGYRYLSSFTKESFPVFEYRAGGVHLRKTVAAVHGENTTLILYEALQAPEPFVLELLPLIAARDFHSLARANGDISGHGEFEEGLLRIRPYDALPEIFILVPGSSFQSRPDWYYDHEYAAEQDRGLDFREDLFSPGVFRLPIGKGVTLGVIVSTAPPVPDGVSALLERERDRREALLRGLPFKQPTRPPWLRELARSLVLAADQFVVRRGEELRTIIAGYPWFADWGRDTMISLPGICLVTGRFEEARSILRAFAASLSRGMLPNRFPDRGQEPEYNSVDATLWFFVAVWEYSRRVRDPGFLREEMLVPLLEIVRWFDRGTRFGIHTDTDGLLCAGQNGVQLTWMDARIGDWVVTPRQGKAVEVNALWYNALRIAAELLDGVGKVQAAGRLTERAAAVRERFQALFWNPAGGYLFDVVDESGGDARLRPNQLLALSLPFPLFDPAVAAEAEKAGSVLRAVRDKLCTPVGLRTLSPDDPAYHPRYEGGAYDRDSAYHQGTVWPWLLGPLVTALNRFAGADGNRDARQLLKGLAPHLDEAGMGSVSEIFDAEAPHRPRGCIAQAWSVGELLRALVEMTAVDER